MSDVNLKKYSASELFRIFCKQRSRRYEREGRFLIRKIMNKDSGDRLLAFLADSIVMLAPIYLWMIILFMIFADILSVKILWIVHLITLVLLAVTLIFVHPMLCALMDGQSIGKVIYEFKIVENDGSQANKRIIFLREAFGKGIPLLALGVFFGLLGVIAYVAINVLFILVDRKHRSIIDLFTKTRVVVLNAKTAKAPVKEVVKPQPIKRAAPIITSPNKVDLHMHSTFSDDGEFNVEEIFQIAAKRGMDVISITDHNSAKANLIAQRMSKLYHVEYIPGIEIDCQYNGRDLHMLGYFIDYKHEVFNKIENDNVAREKEASMKRVENWERYSGMKVDVEALLKNNRFQTIPGEMIGEQMLNNPKYRNSPLLQPYISGDRTDMPYVNFYWDFFAQGKPCHVPIRYPDVRVIIKAIKATGGIPVIAHPYNNFKDDISIVEELIDLGVEGIEVFSSYHDKKQMSELLKIANERKCYITAGSDFHGKNKPQLQIGDTGCPVEAEKILNRFIYAKR